MTTPQPHRPHVIAVMMHSKGRPPEPMTMAKHPSRKMPRTAVELSATVWYMPKTNGLDHGNNASVYTQHLGWTYYLPAKRWNASQMIEPRIEVLS
jgi:hypothetical protein